MISLQHIEQELTASLKARDQLRTDVLRGLKTSIMNEKIAKQKELSEEEITVLIKREVKKRKDSAEAFAQGGRPELAQKEQSELEMLAGFLPPEMPEEEIVKAVDGVLSEGSFTAKDFGTVMGKLKASLGPTADGALLAKILKEKLK